MTQLKVIFGIILWFYSLPAFNQTPKTDIGKHVMFGCQLKNCPKEHSEVIIKTDSSTQLRLEITKITSGLNVSMGGYTPARTTTVYKLFKGEVFLEEVVRKTTQRGCRVKLHKSGYIEFNPKEQRFIVYEKDKKKYFDAEGQLLKEEAIKAFEDVPFAYWGD